MPTSLLGHRVELCLQEVRRGAARGRQLVAYFQWPPMMAELHLPMRHHGGKHLTILSFLPVNVATPCWLYGVQHGELMYPRRRHIAGNAQRHFGGDQRRS